MDEKLFFLLNSLANQNKTGDFIVTFFAVYLPYIVIAVFLLFLLSATYSKKEKITIAVGAFISGFISRYVIVALIRFLWHRPRPFTTTIHEIHKLFEETSYSFPSGHASFFFALAMLAYFYNKSLGSVFFIAAIFISLARVAAGVHYPSDVFAGMIVGILSAWTTFTYITPHLKKWLNKERK